MLLWDAYVAGQRKIISEMEMLRNKDRLTTNWQAGHGLPLKTTSALLPGSLRHKEAHECFLMHGIQPENILSIVKSGFNEHFSGAYAGTAFGDGVYLAEDGMTMRFERVLNRNSHLTPRFLTLRHAQY